jgi:N-acetylglutamate synthase-like GNAT family acetyltransferase
MKNSANKTTQSESGSSAVKVNGTGISLPAVSVLQQKEAEEPIQEFPVQQKTTGQFSGSAGDESQSKPLQLKSNDTGMPDQLKSGVENLSGMSMDHVKVHYNSSQPAQLNALAYAQGSDIHIGPGQEKHLPHEAWHVVQQAQGRVQPTTQMKAAVPVNDDPGLEHEADVMGDKAMQMKLGPAYKPTNAQNSSVPPSVFQMKPRKAVVDWAVTHLVQEQKDSLFGKDEEDGWKAGELPVELGELRKGQPITVDDEIVFMSRRGSNQEKPKNRAEDSVKELKHKWNLVLAVDEANYEGEKVFIRSETIKLAEEKTKGKQEIGIIEIPEKEAIGAKVSDQLTVIRDAWTDESRKRRRSIGQVKYKDDSESLESQDLSSGWNWDQYDEGEDVAGDMAVPEYRTFSLSNQPTNLMLKAYYQGEGLDVPIAFLMMEADTKALRPLNDKAQDERFFYIRWLVGHPAKKGGGSAVMELAMQKAVENQLAIYVQVAYSATDWYKKMGFKVIEEGKFLQGEGYGDTLLKYETPE